MSAVIFFVIFYLTIFSPGIGFAIYMKVTGKPFFVKDGE